MDFKQADMRALLTGVISHGLRGEYVDYAAAEQATMALAAIIDAMKDAEMLTQPQYQGLINVLNKCYDAVEKDEAYEPKKFLGALQALEAAVPKA
jgi:ribulose 1,5-bisphosphate carboxylase large subunit-like protein